MIVGIIIVDDSGLQSWVNSFCQSTEVSGGAPHGKQLEGLKSHPHYKDGEFQICTVR